MAALEADMDAGSVQVELEHLSIGLCSLMWWRIWDRRLLESTRLSVNK